MSDRRNFFLKLFDSDLDAHEPLLHSLKFADELAPVVDAI